MLNSVDMRFVLLFASLLFVASCVAPGHHCPCSTPPPEKSRCATGSTQTAAGVCVPDEGRDARP